MPGRFSGGKLVWLGVLPWVVGTSFAAQRSEGWKERGVKIVEVDKNWGAAKAGIQAGDVISGWMQGNESGSISDPIALYLADTERGPQGEAKLIGRRNGKRATWILKSGYWGFSEAEAPWEGVPSVIAHLKELAKAKKFDVLEEYCRKTCAGLEGQSGARAFALYQAARLLIRAGQSKEGDEFFSRSVEETPGRLSYFKVFVYIGWANFYFYRENDFARAEGLFSKGLRESDNLKRNSLTSAYYLQSLAECKVRTGDGEEADRLFQRALRIDKALAPEQDQTMEALMGAGAVASERGEGERAEALFREALALVKKSEHQEDKVSFLYLNLGVNAYLRGNFAESEKHFLASLSLARKFQLEDRVAEAYSDLADLAAMQGNPSKAESLLQRAIEVQKSQPSSSELKIAEAESSLASIKLGEGDAASAIEHEQRALPVFERLLANNRQTVDALVTYGNALRKHAEYQKAEGALRQAQTIELRLNTRTPAAARVGYAMAELHAEEGKLEEAETEHRAALKIREALAPKSLWRAESLGALAEVEERLGKLDSAMAHYAQAIDLFEVQRSNLTRTDSLAFDQKYPNYNARFGNLLLARKQEAHAFEVVDHARARTLSGTLAENHVNIRSGIPAALLAKDQKQESALATLADQRIRVLTTQKGKGLAELDKKIGAAETEHELAESEMRLANPRYAALTQRKAPTLKQIQAALGPETALLEYSLSKDHGHVFALDAHKLAVFELAPGAELERLARATYSGWSKAGQRTEGAVPAESLSERVIGPAADFIQGHRRLVIVADGSLQSIPFAALPLPRQLSGRGEPLATRFEVVSLPSASLLPMLRLPRGPAQGKALNAVAVIGDPVFTRDDPRMAGAAFGRPASLGISRGGDEADSPSEADPVESATNEDSAIRGLRLNRLIHSREEVEAIASVTPPKRLFVALDFDANRDTALGPKVTGSRIIHFATHGVFDAKDPAMSGLVLSLFNKEGKAQAGFLGLNEIYSTHLNADLVVASACETALGQEMNGEGLVGLTWGFIYAGAKGVVASLWRVNDASTAELMRLFYEGMEKKGLTPAAALREAQMEIARRPEWSAPYYWAGFVFEGEYAKDERAVGVSLHSRNVRSLPVRR